MKKTIIFALFLAVAFVCGVAQADFTIKTMMPDNGPYGGYTPISIELEDVPDGGIKAAFLFSGGTQYGEIVSYTRDGNEVYLNVLSPKFSGTPSGSDSIEVKIEVVGGSSTEAKNFTYKEPAAEDFLVTSAYNQFYSWVTDSENPAIDYRCAGLPSGGDSIIVRGKGFTKYCGVKLVNTGDSNDTIDVLEIYFRDSNRLYFRSPELESGLGEGEGKREYHIVVTDAYDETAVNDVAVFTYRNAAPWIIRTWYSPDSIYQGGKWIYAVGRDFKADTEFYTVEGDHFTRSYVLGVPEDTGAVQEDADTLDDVVYTSEEELAERIANASSFAFDVRELGGHPVWQKWNANYVCVSIQENEAFVGNENLVEYPEYPGHYKLDTVLVCKNDPGQQPDETKGIAFTWHDLAPEMCNVYPNAGVKEGGNYVFVRANHMTDKNATTITINDVTGNKTATIVWMYCYGAWIRVPEGDSHGQLLPVEVENPNTVAQGESILDLAYTYKDISPTIHYIWPGQVNHEGNEYVYVRTDGMKRTQYDESDPNNQIYSVYYLSPTGTEVGGEAILIHPDDTRYYHSRCTRLKVPRNFFHILDNDSRVEAFANVAMDVVSNPTRKNTLNDLLNAYTESCKVSEYEVGESGTWSPVLGQVAVYRGGISFSYQSPSIYTTINAVKRSSSDLYTRIYGNSVGIDGKTKVRLFTGDFSTSAGVELTDVHRYRSGAIRVKITDADITGAGSPSNNMYHLAVYNDSLIARGFEDSYYDVAENAIMVDNGSTLGKLRYVWPSVLQQNTKVWVWSRISGGNAANAAISFVDESYVSIPPSEDGEDRILLQRKYSSGIWTYLNTPGSGVYYVKLDPEEGEAEYFPITIDDQKPTINMLRRTNGLVDGGDRLPIYGYGFTRDTSFFVSVKVPVEGGTDKIFQERLPVAYFGNSNYVQVRVPGYAFAEDVTAGGNAEEYGNIYSDATTAPVQIHISDIQEIESVEDDMWDTGLNYVYTKDKPEIRTVRCREFSAGQWAYLYGHNFVNPRTDTNDNGRIDWGDTLDRDLLNVELSCNGAPVEAENIWFYRPNFIRFKIPNLGVSEDFVSVDIIVTSKYGADTLEDGATYYK